MKWIINLHFLFCAGEIHPTDAPLALKQMVLSRSSPLATLRHLTQRKPTTLLYCPVLSLVVSRTRRMPVPVHRTLTTHLLLHIPVSRRSTRRRQQRVGQATPDVAFLRVFSGRCPWYPRGI